MAHKWIWLAISSLLFYHIHHLFTLETFNNESIKLSFLGLLDLPVNFRNFTFYPHLVFVYKVLSFLGIIVFLNLIYEWIMRRITSLNLKNIDPQTLETDHIPDEIERLLNGEDIDHLESTPNIPTNDFVSIAFQGKTDLLKQHKRITIDDYLQEINKLVGLHAVKKEIKSIINFLKVNQMRVKKGIPSYDLSYHMVFTGNPGTGKTTIARILANIFKELNLLSSGHLVEVDRSGLVAGYMGQTALKVKEVIETAKGGVLFIDEAYSLLGDGSQNDYGKEAVETLLKYMEDYRNDLIVIVAGYSDLMEKFVNWNPGLKSRFSRFIQFEDYTPKELLGIMIIMAKKSNYRFSEKALGILEEYFKKVYSNHHQEFANGRGVRNLFEKIVTGHANRIATLTDPSEETLCSLISKDVVLVIHRT